MSLLRTPIQNKLSALLGTPVTFEKLSLSPLGGVVEVHGISVTGEGGGPPLLTVARARAEVALTRALSRQLLVKSLTLERPILTVVRRADGRTNLPLMRGGDGNDPHARGWRLDARKVLLVDGEVHLRDESLPGYRASAVSIVAEMHHVDGEVEFTLIADSVGRRDEPAELGPVQGTGRLRPVQDLSALGEAAADVTMHLAKSLRLDLKVPSLRRQAGRLTARGTIDLSLVWALLPHALGHGLPRRIGGIRGSVELFLEASYDPATGLRVPALTLRAAETVIVEAPAPR